MIENKYEVSSKHGESKSLNHKLIMISQGATFRKLSYCMPLISVTYLSSSVVPQMFTKVLSSLN